MSHIQDVLKKTEGYFSHLSNSSYVRLLDTPHVWGAPFGKAIMPQAIARYRQFSRAVEEVIQTTDVRCDIASLNTPDPDWARIIMGAIDTAMTQKRGRKTAPQIRFIFGQTPLNAAWEPANYVDFKGALIRLLRQRASEWETKPEIWCGRFYRLEEGIRAGVLNKFSSGGMKSTTDIDITKMTWNHAKIIAADGVQALAGGHNLNTDLFTSYPPVHDVSVVVHGDAALGAQKFLNEMWECKSDLLSKEYLDVDTLTWKSVQDDKALSRLPVDPLASSANQDFLKKKLSDIIELHDDGDESSEAIVEDSLPSKPKLDTKEQIISFDKQAIGELALGVFPVRQLHRKFEDFSRYHKADSMLSIGKYWTGSSMKSDYQKASEIMKEHLIKSAKSSIWMSQMDLISAWKKNWSDHVVCHWLMEALLSNPELVVKVVVSPLDAGAGAEGDQYSFGSGASRTFALIDYYMKHEVATDKEIPDPKKEREAALKRLHISPFFYTDQVPFKMQDEGNSYKWPGLSEAGKTASIKQPPLSTNPPKAGVIGSAYQAVLKAGGFKGSPVDSAPGNHAKIMIIDNESYVVGSDNLYPGFLSEFNYLVEGKDAVGDMVNNYWKKLWSYSGPQCANSYCKKGDINHKN
ncbi:phospholipase [Vibrio coralliilyticus]|uniref:phospholipase n=1 Tax=Vibrio coralliilyticus TaxID=190893 RepID=UPI000BAABDEE|nr:phospholipase [Vibrio coralliilyticus]NOI59029.1 phospholipase [Vibrio coralliilyticus]PAT70145.1 phospholipase [Vibrio coralliilyticus]